MSELCNKGTSICDYLLLFLLEIKIRSIGLFRVSLVENIIIPQGVVDMDKRIATIIGMNLQRL